MEAVVFERIIGGLCFEALIGRMTAEELGLAVLEVNAERVEESLDVWAKGLK